MKGRVCRSAHVAFTLKTECALNVLTVAPAANRRLHVCHVMASSSSAKDHVKVHAVVMNMWS
jgi:hypothetical protein